MTTIARQTVVPTTPPTFNAREHFATELQRTQAGRLAELAHGFESLAAHGENWSDSGSILRSEAFMKVDASKAQSTKLRGHLDKIARMVKPSQPASDAVASARAALTNVDETMTRLYSQMSDNNQTLMWQYRKGYERGAELRLIADDLRAVPAALDDEQQVMSLIERPSSAVAQRRIPGALMHSRFATFAGGTVTGAALLGAATSLL